MRVRGSEGPEGLIGCLGNQGPGGGRTLRKLGLLSAVTSRRGTSLGVRQAESGHDGESHSPAWGATLPPHTGKMAGNGVNIPFWGLLFNSSWELWRAFKQGE